MSRAVAQGARAESQVFPNCRPGATRPCQQPQRKLHAGVFFDGTNNNMQRDRPSGGHTNVVRLYDLYRTGSSPQAVLQKFYIDGVGSLAYGQALRRAGWGSISPAAGLGRFIREAGGDLAGKIGGAGGKERLVRAFLWLRARCGEMPPRGEKTVDIYGFSRGAAQARTFVNLVNMSLRQREVMLHVRFVGVFDTVGSFGVPGDESDPNHNLYIDGTDAQDIRHFVARHEVRQNFPLTRLTDRDREYAGVHSDVGGGYAPRDGDGKLNHIAYIPLLDMAIASTRCGVLMNDCLALIQRESGLDARELQALRRSADTYAGPGHSVSTPGGPWARAAAQFRITYIHESAVPRGGVLQNIRAFLSPNGEDRTGARRKFTPRRFRLRRHPPDFAWG